MRKLHQLNYSQIFSRDFKTKTIDNRLEDLELDEKLLIIDKVIDYLVENFRELSPIKRHDASPTRIEGDAEYPPDFDDTSVEMDHTMHRGESAYKLEGA